MISSEGIDAGRDGAALSSLSTVMAAAHELKSPLVLIRQLVFAASDTQVDSEELGRILDQLMAVTDRSLRLTTDLTKTARLDDGLFAIEPVNAQQLCEMIVRQISPLYVQCGKVIRVKLRRTTSPVLAHRELLSSLLYHFADNALHYGDDNSEVSVVLQERSAAGLLRIGVRDTGPAMSLREWRKLRSSPQGSIATRPGGSGLGLYIADQFANAMGGTIGLTQHRDGVTFYVDLPLSEQLALL
jgi:signal transduction histidine kinase